jgi:NMD protein affecting ribosome stability and mRNA decay
MERTKSTTECINCGTPLRLYNTKEVLCGMCPKCVAEDKKIPLTVNKKEVGSPPTNKFVGIRA